MYINKNILCFLLFFTLILLGGCASSYAPDNWLPETEAFPENVYGGWITVTTEPDSLDKNGLWKQYSGEFIALNDSSLFLLYDSLYQIPKTKVVESVLELDQKNSSGYTTWTCLGLAATVSNGVFLIFTAPAWLIFGIPTISGESARDRYEMKYPDFNYWEEINKYARFPQGLPPSLNLNELKQKHISEE